MSMWKTGVSFHSFSLFLSRASLFFGCLYYRTRADVWWLLGRPCCEQNNWSFIQPFRRLILSFSLRKGNEKEKRRRRLRRQSLKSLTHTQLEGAWYSLLRVSDCASHLVSFSFIFRSLLFVVRCCCCCEMSWNFKWVWATFLTRLNIDFILPLTLTQQQQQ